MDQGKSSSAKDINGALSMTLRKPHRPIPTRKSIFKNYQQTKGQIVLTYQIKF